MNIIFTTQSIGLHVFWKLFKELREQFPDDLNRVGFFSTNKDEFESFVSLTPEFLTEVDSVLCEWDILSAARELRNVDYSYIEDWEERIGDDSLWNAIVCDRRFNYSVRAQYVQDYKPSYDHQELLKILQAALRSISLHIKQTKPDAIIGLNAVTMYDYLYYLMAVERGIPYFQLKLTRVENYVSLFTNPLGISPHIGSKILSYLVSPDELDRKSELLNNVKEFISKTRGRSLSYEGAISKSNDAKQTISITSGASVASRQNLSKRIKQFLLNEHKDKHYPAPRDAQLYARLIKPWRKGLVWRTVFKDSERNWEEKLHGNKYAVYPLNTEPEVALLVYGRSYRNQIETVRNIAINLPVGWKLVVKEHPNSMGYRSKSYYKKLQEIPNVVLLGPKVDTGAVISGADLVFVVFGTIGLEAIMKEKPLITFCNTPYGSFPDNMVQFVDNMSELGRKIRDLLNSYKYDERALVAYVAAHIEASVRINLFTGLLGKSNRNAPTATSSLNEQYQSLASYTWKRIAEEKKRLNEYEA